jgi:hypothetical protein
MNADAEKAVEFETLLVASGATFKDCLIADQQKRKEAIANIVRCEPKPRKRRKAVTQRDVTNAVNVAIDSAMRELRTHKSDLPGWAAAMDFAIAVVAKHKVNK